MGTVAEGKGSQILRVLSAVRALRRVIIHEGRQAVLEGERFSAKLAGTAYEQLVINFKGREAVRTRGHGESLFAAEGFRQGAHEHDAARQRNAVSFERRT